MSTFLESMYKIRNIDNLAENESVIHDINPVIKFVVTISYIITVVSFDKYSISNLIPLILYPMIIMYLGDIPISIILRVLVMGLPFIIGIGIFNIFFDKSIILTVENIYLTGGIISFISLIIKGVLSISSSVIFICTTGIEGLCNSLRIIGIPKIFTTQLLLTYRYTYVLIDMVGEVYNAYMLRANNQKGINFKMWGPLLGQILLRSFDKAELLYQAMILRGFQGEYILHKKIQIKLKDIAYILLWITFFIIIKFVNVPVFIGDLIMR